MEIILRKVKEWIRSFVESIRWRFFFFINLMVLGLIIGISIVLIFFQQIKLEEDHRTNAVFYGKYASGSFLEMVIRWDAPFQHLVKHLTPILEENKDLIHVWLLSRDGVIFFDSTELASSRRYMGKTRIAMDKILIDALPRLKHSLWIDYKSSNKRLNLVVPILEGKIHNYSCLFVFSYNSVVKKIAAIRNRIIFLSIIVLGISSLIVLILVSGITKPIQKLTETIMEIANGNLEKRVSVNSRDEIGKLGHSFNNMTNQLKTTLDALSKERDNLEKNVEKRTKELQNALGKYSELNKILEKKVKEQVSILEKESQLKRYLPPQLVEIILSGEREVTVTSHRKKLTVFFSDIKDFTLTTDSMEPEELTKLLNHYLAEMSNIIFKYGGTIDKFIGDAIMVFFGDPVFENDKKHATNCVLMAREMQQKMKSLQQTWINQGIERPLQIRCGVNTGYITVGNFGSPQRVDYTIIGGQVNLAARLESKAKPGEVIISHATYAFIKDIIKCESKGEITVKGIARPIKIYKVL